jgi:hypothetical protein
MPSRNYSDDELLHQLEQMKAEADEKSRLEAREIAAMKRQHLADERENAEAEAQAELAHHTDFDKSLFANGYVDFENYIGVNELFSKFTDEARNGVDVSFAGYQKSLLHLLKHCYGYMYALKTDSERYTSDIKYINAAISGLNRSSNKNNPLSTKIVKLVWAHERIDRRRISTYAKVLDNAWCKGVVDKHTDSKGSVLPKHFEREVMSKGGINTFSRQSAASIQRQSALEAEGYANLAEKKIDVVNKAIKDGTFEWDGKTLSMPKDIEPFPTKPNTLRDGALLLFLVRNDRKNDCLVPIYPLTAESFVEKTKLAMFDELNEKAKANEK